MRTLPDKFPDSSQGPGRLFLRPQPQAFSAQGDRIVSRSAPQAADKSVKAYRENSEGLIHLPSKMCRLRQGGAPAARLRQKMREVGDGFKDYLDAKMHRAL